MNRAMRRVVFGIVTTILVVGGMLVGFTVREAQAEGIFCPGDDYCYTTRDCEACKTMLCYSLCPDPGEQGSRCYVCAQAN